MKLFLKIISALTLTVFSSNLVISCSSNTINKTPVAKLMNEFNTILITKNTTNEQIRNDIKKYLIAKTNIDESIINTDKAFYYGVKEEINHNKKIYVTSANQSFDFKYYGSWTKELLAINIDEDNLDIDMKQEKPKKILIQNAKELQNIKIKVDKPKIISAELKNKNDKTYIILKANKIEETGIAKVTVQADNGLLETIKINTIKDKSYF